MLTKFVEGLGGKLAEQWVASLLTPAFVFWAGGFTVWVHSYGWAEFRNMFTALSFPVQIVALVAGLLAVGVSALVVRRFEALTLRLLEGYWPRLPPIRWLRRKLVRRKANRVKSMVMWWGELKVKEVLGPLTPEESEDLRALEWKIHYVPSTPEHFMPTKLGNVLRAAELRPLITYGLDVIVCWPRLWLLLPAEAKKDLTDARADLDAGVRIYLWGFLFLAWSPLARDCWVLLLILVVSTLTLAFSYFYMMITAAEVYGSLLESTFDLYRPALYKALRWPSPSNPSEEKAEGHALMKYLWRGLSKDNQVFTKEDAKPLSPPSPPTITVNAPDVVRILRQVMSRR